MPKYILFFFLLPVLSARSQSLLKGLEDSVQGRQKVVAAFKSTRVINAHSMEMLAKGNLDFRILHRFSSVNLGIQEWFGLDHASMRMSFDYGLTNNLTIGGGRSTLRKEFDGFLKARLLQQTTGPNEMPFSLVAIAGSIIHTEPILKSTGAKLDLSVADRTSHYVQVVIGRKFSQKFSLQLSPIYVHRNIVDYDDEGRNIFALGGGARFKVSKRMALTADYHHPLSGLHTGYHDPLSLGLDIETGGHVFQLHFSNTDGMNERAYITETTGKFFSGDIRFGFNLSRIFKLGHRQTYKG